MNLNTFDTGILYGVVGERYINEAAQSAAYARKYLPEVPIALAAPPGGVTPAIFDLQIELPPGVCGYEAKVAALPLTPFKKTLFLDSDAYIVLPCMELFEVLDHFDIALAHDPWRNGPEVGVPDTFPEFNSGVIAYRIDDCRKALEDWVEEFRLHRETDAKAPDQASFRKVTYHSGLRIAPLPMEYNCRAGLPGFLGANAAVKIIHWRTDNPEELARHLNSTLDYRAVLQSAEQLGCNLILTSGGGRMLMKVFRILGSLRHRLRKETEWDRVRRQVFTEKSKALGLIDPN